MIYFKQLTLLFFFCVGLHATHVVAQKNYVDYVNTLQGTNSDFHLTRGNTYPTTALTFWYAHLDAADR